MLIRLKDFGGLAPKVSDRSLPPNFAAEATNVQLYSGELRGLDELKQVADLTAEVYTVKRAYRLYDGSTSISDTLGSWVPFDDPDVNFLRGALVNDQYDRYYAAGGTQEPVVASAAGWTAGSPIYDMGVPAPTVKPTVVAPAAGSVDETRAYVYTFVNEWGEESAPSPVSDVATGDVTGTWQLSNMSIAFPTLIITNPNPIAAIRIYRTVTGTNSVNYRFVDELTPPTPGDPLPASYNDNKSIDTVSLNESLPSLGWDIPPVGLQGIVNMANGIMVGFVGRDLYFSEQYRPHAWPSTYVLSTDSDIVGLGVYQSGVVVCTTANPFVATGVNPASVVLTKLDDVEPCASARSIVSGLDGVTYTSPNGLILVNQEGAKNIIKPLINRNEWRQEYSPFTAMSASDGSRLISFTSSSVGYLFRPLEPLGYLSNLKGFVDIQAVQTDSFTGEAYVIAQDTVRLWNPTDTAPLIYTWKSKVFETTYPVNMGAYRLQYEDIISGADYVPGFDYTNYNTDRITTPLNTLNQHPLNGVAVVSGVTDSPPVVQNKSPIGGSPLYPSTYSPSDGIKIKIWGDDVLRYEDIITSNDMVRLPSGYKADKWQIEFTTAQNIYSFNLAGTAKELRTA
jgi:hypothetical protein